MIASVSKVFTASAVSIAISKGLIGGLDDDICNVVPAWASSACRNPRHADVPVTWRMMVTHRSSMRENIPEVVDEFGDFYTASYGPTGAYQGDAVGNPTCPLTDVQGFYRDFFTDKVSETSVGSSFTAEGGGSLNWYRVGQADGGAWLNYKPGASSTYSNLAMGYIAALIELASGQSFEDFTQNNMFKPLGMTRTSWFRSQLPSDTLETLPISYSNGRFVDEQHYCYIDYASGQVRSTASDLSKFLTAMLDYGAPTLWSDTIGRAALACQEQNGNGNTLPPSTCEYGTGWGFYNNDSKGDEAWMKPLMKYDWTNAGEHSGSELGVQTEMLVLPEAGVYLVVLTNTDGNGDLAAQQLAKVLIEAVQVDPPLTTPSTPSPTAAPTGSFCFSGQSIVQVEGKGDVLMKDVKIGDRVLVDDDSYEEIYSFGHRHDTQEHDYLRLLPTRLEVSKYHMVFVQNRGMVPAALLQIGDQLSDGAAISSIEIVSRRGVYAPFSTSGTIMVNKVLASTYIAFQNSEYLMIGTFMTPFRYQWLAHTFLLPQRMWCQWFGGHDETYSDNGISTWLERPFQFTQWMLKQSSLVTALLLIPCLVLLVTILVIEKLFSASMLLLIAGGLGYIVLQECKISVETTKPLKMAFGIRR